MRARLSRLAILLMLAAGAFAMLPTPGTRSENCSSMNGYYVASLNAEIDAGAADFLAGAVSSAESACAGHFVFVLSTNGGDGGSMQSMISSISGYEGWGGNFTTLISPAGSYAFSAGAYIAQASDAIVMVHGTTIGSATPIVPGIPVGEENTTLTKDISAFASYMQTLTVNKDRNGTATRLMVTRGVSYTDTEALRYHVVDQVTSAATTDSALAQLGVPADTRVDTPGVRSRAISVLSNPNVSSLMFLIGTFAILADVYHPTLVLTVVGVVLIALALFGFGVFGASPLAVLLMVIGAAFIFLEIKTQHGVSAIIGVVIFIVGFLLVSKFPPISPLNPSLPAITFTSIPELSYALVVAIGIAIVLASLYLRSIRDALMDRPRVNEPSQAIGKTGTMNTNLVAGGKGVATIGAEQWTVRCSTDLKTGDAVKVKELKGLELIVEKEV